MTDNIVAEQLKRVRPLHESHFTCVLRRLKTPAIMSTGSKHFMQKADEHWMSRCLELAALAAAEGEVPVGAVIVKNNEIIGAAYNQPIGAKDPSAHAEIQALRAAAQSGNNYRLPDTTMYVSLEPCTMCAGALIYARVERLVYGALEPRAGAIVSRAQVLDSDYLNHRVAHSGGCMAEESSKLLKNFFQAKRI